MHEISNFITSRPFSATEGGEMTRDIDQLNSLFKAMCDAVVSPLAEGTSAVRRGGTGHKDAGNSGNLQGGAGTNLPVFPNSSWSPCDAFCLSVAAAWFHPVSAQE